MMSDGFRWWISYKKRFVDEVRAVQKLVDADAHFSKIEWDVSDESIGFRGRLSGTSAVWDFVLTYPDLFPRVCPYVRPQDGKSRWTSHQYGLGGSLCLEIGPDNWKPTHSAADLLRSMEALLLFEELHPPGKGDEAVESRHSVTPGQQLTGEWHRLLDDSVLRDALAASELQYGECVFGTAVNAGALVHWAKELPLGNPLKIPHGLAHTTHLKVEGRFFKIALPTDVPSSVEWLHIYEFAELVIQKCLEQPAHDLFVEAPKDSLIVLSVVGGPLLVYRLSNDGEKRRFKLLPIAEGNREVRTPTELKQALGKTSVAIVGLGSVGSKVAVSLARCGVNTFILVDDDILSFGNVSRHAATLQTVGAHKVDVVADLIHQVSDQEPVVAKFKTRILGQNSAQHYSNCIELVAAADVIIDCTANGEVFQYLSELASIAKKAFVWGEVFAGGFGGLIGCAAPASSPCPRCVHRAIIDYCSTLPPAPSRVGAAAYSDGVLEADDNSVSLVANMIALRAKAAICEPASVGDAPAWLVGFQRGWIFDREFEVRAVSARVDDYHCGQCWCPAATESECSAEELEEYRTTLQKLSSEKSS